MSNQNYYDKLPPAPPPVITGPSAADQILRDYESAIRKKLVDEILADVEALEHNVADMVYHRGFVDAIAAMEELLRRKK